LNLCEINRLQAENSDLAGLQEEQYPDGGQNRSFDQQEGQQTF